jgi:hypothetical protein
MNREHLKRMVICESINLIHKCIEYYRSLNRQTYVSPDNNILKQDGKFQDIELLL